MIKWQGDWAYTCMELWNLRKKTEKDWKLSFMVNHHFDLPSWTMWYFPWMKSLQAQFCCVNCWYPVLHLRKHVVTASAVLIRMCKVIFALKKSSQIREGWVKVEEAWMADQSDDFITMESFKSFSVFQMDKWRTHKKTWKYGEVKLHVNLSSGWLLVLF